MAGYHAAGGGMKQLALALVPGAVEQQRVRSQERLEDRVGLAGPKLVRVTGEDLLDRRRIAEEDR